MSVQIDPEFRSLIAPLQENERAQLEANIVANGCRDPLVLWRNLLVDGHNRYEICTRLKITFRTVEIVLPSRAHVLLWIEENQLGRRNLTDDQRSVIAHGVLKRRVELAKSERAKKGGRGHKRNLPDTATGKFKDRSKDSRVVVSKASRVSERKLRTVAGSLSRPRTALAAIRSGDKTVAEVKGDLKRAAKARLVEEITAQAPAFPEGPFRVLVIDPPWRYGSRNDDSTHRAANPYPDMEPRGYSRAAGGFAGP